MGKEFKLHSNYSPKGDQPKAIKELSEGVESGFEHQTLLGVTGSGKTFTIANVVEKEQKPTLVIAHNKTLAAQLAQEYKNFFPQNAVHYFVSYYDYYQPEAYIPVTDTYIEKEAQINEEIDRLRHAATQSLFTRRDVIIVASVSCIYGLGSPEEYEKKHLKLEVGNELNRSLLIRKLIDIYFERTNADLTPGTFRALGNSVEIMPVNEKAIYKIDFEENKISALTKIDSTSRSVLEKMDVFFLFPAKHFVTPEDEKERATAEIKEELNTQLKKFENEGKLLEAERLKRRVNHDLALIKEVGYCSGIENYSRHFDRRKAGEPPHTLLSYFPKKENGEADFLTVIDESHVTIPQIGGMYVGDRSRKRTLVEHGFRLPSAVGNRPLTFDEFEKRVGGSIYTSATPGKYEFKKSRKVVEQIIRPTGLIDPELSVMPVIENGNYPGQVKDFIEKTEKEIEKGSKVMATTLTKKMAEDLSEFLKKKGIKTEYLHSEIHTIDRINIITNFRKGEFDCLVGVNLLREGLDIPEVSFIGILDADKEGFLRSETSLTQTIGRASRNSAGKVTLYADKITNSMKRAMDETERRRNIQMEYNKKHNITPQTIKKKVEDITDQMRTEREKTAKQTLEIELKSKKPAQLKKEKEKRMNEVVKNLDFETAAILRDEIYEIEKKIN